MERQKRKPLANSERQRRFREKKITAMHDIEKENHKKKENERVRLLMKKQHEKAKVNASEEYRTAMKRNEHYGRLHIGKGRNWRAPCVLLRAVSKTDKVMERLTVVLKKLYLYLPVEKLLWSDV